MPPPPLLNSRLKAEFELHGSGPVTANEEQEERWLQKQFVQQIESGKCLFGLFFSSSIINQLECDRINSIRAQKATI